MKSKSVIFFFLTLFLLTTLLICFQLFSQKFDSGTNLNTINSKNDDLNDFTDNQILDFELKTAVKEDWHQYWSYKRTGSYGEKITIDSMDNIYIVGESEIDASLYEYITVVKYNSTGKYQWETLWRPSDAGMIVNGRDIALDTYGNIYVVGDYSKQGTSDEKILLVKFDSSGNFQWNRTWNTAQYDCGNGIALDSNNNIYIAGEIVSGLYIYTNNFTLIKYNSLGEYQWNRTICGDDVDKKDGALAVTVDTLDYIYVGGYTQSYAGFEDTAFLIVKYDSLGEQIWNTTWGYAWNNKVNSIDVDSSFNVYVAGVIDIGGPQDSRMCYAKFDNNGNYQWNYTFGVFPFSEYVEGKGVIVNSENEIYCTGYYNTHDIFRGIDIITLKFNNTGTMLWNFTWNSDNNGEDYSYDIALDSKESIYVGGWTYGTLNGLPSDRFFLVKIVQTPGTFILTDNAGDPDLDGLYDLLWTKSDSAENYSIYEDDSYITQVNGLIPIAEGVKSLNYRITNKANGTYYYKVVAFNKYGNASSGCIDIVVNRTPPGDFFLTTNAGNPNINGTFYLNWTASSYASNYSLYRDDSYIYNVNEAILIDKGLTNRSYIFTNYANGTYYFRMVSFNINGNTSSNCIQIEVKRYKPAVFLLDSDAFDPDKDGSFNLNWTNSQYAESYTIYQDVKYIKEINGTQTKLVEKYKSLLYHVSNLGDGTWYFMVIAFNINGNCSSNCIEVNVVNAPPGPFILYSNATNPEISGFVTISWNQSSDAINYTLYIDIVPITNFNNDVPKISGITTLFYKYTFTKNGDYYLTVVAFNRNGNYTYPTNLIIYVRLSPKPLTLTSDAEKPTDSDGYFKLNWSVAYEFSYFNFDITNYSIYYSTQSFSLINIGIIAGIICLKNNLTIVNFNCTNFGDGTWYFMVVAYNTYGNSSSNCLGITISHSILPSGDDDDDDDGNDSTGNNIILIVVIGSMISGAIGLPSIIVINHKMKANHLKKLNKIVKSVVENPKEGQNLPKNETDS